jgi:hypothetical protein
MHTGKYDADLDEDFITVLAYWNLPDGVAEFQTDVQNTFCTSISEKV